MKNKLLIVLITISLLIVIFLVFSIPKLKTQLINIKSTQNNLEVSCEKEENCCVKDDDCEYIWFTGGCNTSEYVAKTQKENEEKGLFLGEAPPREKVTCTCKSNRCVTHN